MSASRMTCPICLQDLPDRAKYEQHVTTCSVSDAIDQVNRGQLSGSEKLAEISNLGQLARILILAKEYDDAPEGVRRHMYACIQCCDLAKDELILPTHCKACGKEGTMMLADEFIGSLMSDEVPIDPRKDRLH